MTAIKYKSRGLRTAEKADAKQYSPASFTVAAHLRGFYFTVGRWFLFMPKLDDITGRKFLRLLVVGFVGRSRTGRYLWKCQCDCGAIKIVESNNLKSGHTGSCGCLKIGHTTHGHARFKLRSITYKSWEAMKGRCLDSGCKAFKNYGGRGITICERWKSSFENFLADMGEKPVGLTLERVNNGGNYEPSNCVWADRKTQNNNRRDTPFLVFAGERLKVSQWAAKVGIRTRVILRRLGSGWSAEDALMTPLLAQYARKKSEAL